VIRKEAWFSCKTSSSVCLCWELDEPQGPTDQYSVPEVVRWQCVSKSIEESKEMLRDDPTTATPEEVSECIECPRSAGRRFPGATAMGGVSVPDTEFRRSDALRCAVVDGPNDPPTGRGGPTASSSAQIQRLSIPWRKGCALPPGEPSNLLSLLASAEAWGAVVDSADAVRGELKGLWRLWRVTR